MEPAPQALTAAYSVPRRHGWRSRMTSSEAPADRSRLASLEPGVSQQLAQETKKSLFRYHQQQQDRHEATYLSQPLPVASVGEYAVFALLNRGRVRNT